VPATGNLDRVINQQDLDDWAGVSPNSQRTAAPSWYDFNLDG